jgi:hypothetical protein
MPYVTLPERRPGHVPATCVSMASPSASAGQKPAQIRLVRHSQRNGGLAVIASISARGGVQAALQYYAHPAHPGHRACNRPADCATTGGRTANDNKRGAKG